MERTEALTKFNELYQASPTEDPELGTSEVFGQLITVAMGKDGATIEESVEAAELIYALAVDNEYEEPNSNGSE